MRAFYPDSDIDNSSRIKLKIKTLEIVGKGKVECCNCGCKDIRILEINHIYGLPDKSDRKNLYTRIRKGERKTEDLNILCMLCNIAYYIKLNTGLEFKIKFKEKKKKKAHVETEEEFAIRMYPDWFKKKMNILPNSSEKN
jgi:hypothetical protein